MRRPFALSVQLPSGEGFGILLRIGATLMFAVMTACIKALDNSVPLGEVVAFRSVFALIPLLGFLWLSGQFPRGLATTRPLEHLARALLGVAAMFTSFATIRLLPLAEATMLAYLAPALMALMGWALIGESLSPRRVGGIVLGFVGVVVFNLPAFSGSLPAGATLGRILALATAILTAGALIQVRRLTRMGEAVGTIAVWFAIASSIAGVFTLPFAWISPDAVQLLLLAGAGLSGGIAHIFMTFAFRHAEAAALAPFEYLSLLWAVMIGAAVFHELPGWYFLLATPLIVTGAIISVQRVKPSD